LGTTKGAVFIIGAGPGSLDYLTLRGHRLLRQADHLVHDALVDCELLRLVPAHCELHDVGKRAGRPSPPQAEIDQLLVDLCLQGHRVVRLKSGDPFIFGRTGSELQALKAADCPFEVVPGISSALAAPLLAGIPLTDPVWSHGFGVVTAHDPDLLDWPALARLHTLVVLMGSRYLDEIIYRLQQNGCRSDIPVAIIQWAGQPQQQIWEGTLLSIRKITRGATLSPCVMVFGEVIKLRPYFLSPKPPTQDTLPPSATPDPNYLPLSGKTVLVTRASGQSSQFANLLAAQGAQVIAMPALEIRPPSDWEPLDDAIADLSSCDWLLLSSANAVNFFMERVLQQGKDSRALSHLKIAVVGKKTSSVLKQWGLRPDFIPPDFVADAMVKHFPESVAGRRLLFPRVETGGRDLLVKEFSAAGAVVLEVAAYESGCPLEPDQAAVEALRNKQVDVVTFASSKTVEHTCQLLQQALETSGGQALAGVAIASIGPKTSEACLKHFGRVDIEPAEYTLDGLTQAIVTWAIN
jgi:uroporphyrinogen III methyltransferase/synthase